MGDAVNQPGIPGQTTEEPNPFFENHYIIQYGGRYYDPSYGTGPFATSGDHENAASDGVLKGIRAKKKTPGVAQLTYTRVGGN